MRDGEYALDEMPPMARHMVWSECYEILYTYPPREVRKENPDSWWQSKEIVHGATHYWMAWVEVDNENWIKSLNIPDDWGEIKPCNLDDEVDKWHEIDTNVELHEYLGLTWKQYTNWIQASRCPECGSTDPLHTNFPCDDGANEWHGFFNEG